MSYSKRKPIDIYSDVSGKISDYDILKNVPTIDGVPVHGDITESGKYTDETPTAGSKRLITSGAIRAAMERGDLQGPEGLSAYELALKHGFEGSEEEWLESLNSAVLSVNGKTGDVELSAADVHALPDTTFIPEVPENISAFNNDADYVTGAELSGKSDIGHAHDDIYYTEAEVDSLLDSKSDTSHNHDDEYYTENEVDNLLSGKSNTGHTHEDYAKKEELPTVPENVSAFNNDAGYLTEHQSLENYPTKSEVEADFITARAEVVEALGKKQDVLDKYVESVNGYGGVVSLSASDVKALPDTTVIPTVPNNVSEFVNDAGYLTEHQSLEEYEKKTETDEKIATHNVGESSHQDMRLLIANLVNRLNAIADSDDTTLDQLSEIVAYIKSNKSLIEAITTEKISYTDIVNNLETNVANKPLSASMGVALKAAIDAIVIPTKVSQFENDSGYAKTADVDVKLGNKQDKLSEYVSTVNGKSGKVNLTYSDVGALPADTDIPTVPKVVSAFENDKSYVTSTELNSGLSGKQDKLSSYVSSVNGKSGTVNLTASDVEALPVTTEIPTVPTKVSIFENDAGYLTEHQDLSSYATKSEIPTALPANGGNADTVDSLHFVVSDTVPTVDNRSVITFVVEE